MTIPFHNVVTENKIVLFHLPPHSTHLTKPLDVGVFQPFKHYHTDAIDKAVQLGDEFLSAFQSFRNQPFKLTTIRHAFKSTSLVSFDPDIVLDKVCEKQAQRVETAFRTPSSPSLPPHQRTPQGPASVVKYKQKLQKVYAKLKPGEKVDSSKYNGLFVD